MENKNDVLWSFYEPDDDYHIITKKVEIFKESLYKDTNSYLNVSFSQIELNNLDIITNFDIIDYYDNFLYTLFRIKLEYKKETNTYTIIIENKDLDIDFITNKNAFYTDFLYLIQKPEIKKIMNTLYNKSKFSKTINAN